MKKNNSYIDTAININITISQYKYLMIYSKNELLKKDIIKKKIDIFILFRDTRI